MVFMCISIRRLCVYSGSGKNCKSICNSIRLHICLKKERVFVLFNVLRLQQYFKFFTNLQKFSSILVNFLYHQWSISIIFEYFIVFSEIPKTWLYQWYKRNKNLFIKKKTNWKRKCFYIHIFSLTFFIHSFLFSNNNKTQAFIINLFVVLNNNLKHFVVGLLVLYGKSSTFV